MRFKRLLVFLIFTTLLYIQDAHSVLIEFDDVVEANFELTNRLNGKRYECFEITALKRDVQNGLEYSVLYSQNPMDIMYNGKVKLTGLHGEINAVDVKKGLEIPPSIPDQIRGNIALNLDGHDYLNFSSSIQNLRNTMQNRNRLQTPLTFRNPIVVTRIRKQRLPVKDVSHKMLQLKKLNDGKGQFTWSLKQHLNIKKINRTRTAEKRKQLSTIARSKLSIVEPKLREETKFSNDDLELSKNGKLLQAESQMRPKTSPDITIKLKASESDCASVRKIAKQFRNPNTLGWVEKNCIILKILAPYATCEQFADFVRSCYE